MLTRIYEVSMAETTYDILCNLKTEFILYDVVIVTLDHFSPKLAYRYT